MSYDLEEQNIIKKINEKGYQRILLQLPEGLKPEAESLVPRIEKETGASIFVWFGTNFGACDLPVGVKNLNIDLVVAFGHNRYIKDPKGW
tara:strand:+ start:18127 stop:18396 length:270 start_codon:yes stop_codon:yes gene_type:complete